MSIRVIQSGASGEQLGWVDLDLGSSPGWWAASVATYCPSRMVEHPKSNSTQPSRYPDAPDCSLVRFDDAASFLVDETSFVIVEVVDDVVWMCGTLAVQLRA